MNSHDPIIDAAFPGGNGVVDEIVGDEVRLHQDLRDTEGDWFYWCVRVRGAAGRTLRFTFTRSQPLGVRGPAVSLDGGDSWAWLGAEAVAGNGFTYAFPADPAVEARFSFAMPYQLAHWQRFAAGLAGEPGFSPGVLCTTPAGRAAPLARVGCLSGAPAHRVVITCRHHCCEMMVNYALEGFVEWLLRDSAPQAQWLRREVEFLLVPFVDLDGAEAGDQGKNRRPRDHGRDYQGASLYAVPRALRERLPVWGDGRLHATVDLHCPWIRGEHNEVIYCVGSANPACAVEQEAFSHLLEGGCTGRLPFRATDFLPFGIAWNTGANYASGMSFGRWSGGLPGVRLATAIELPYANAGGAEVNQASARRFGPDLARGLAAYLRTRVVGNAS